MLKKIFGIIRIVICQLTERIKIRIARRIGIVHDFLWSTHYNMTYRPSNLSESSRQYAFKKAATYYKNAVNEMMSAATQKDGIQINNRLNPTVAELIVKLFEKYNDPTIIKDLPAIFSDLENLNLPIPEESATDSSRIRATRSLVTWIDSQLQVKFKVSR